MNIKEVLQVFVCKLPKHHQPGKYHENINETTVLDCEKCIIYTETFALIILDYHLLLSLAATTCIYAKGIDMNPKQSNETTAEALEASTSSETQHRTQQEASKHYRYMPIAWPPQSGGPNQLSVTALL